MLRLRCSHLVSCRSHCESQLPRSVSASSVATSGCAPVRNRRRRRRRHRRNRRQVTVQVAARNTILLKLSTAPEWSKNNDVIVQPFSSSSLSGCCCCDSASPTSCFSFRAALHPVVKTQFVTCSATKFYKGTIIKVFTCFFSADVAVSLALRFVFLGESINDTTPASMTRCPLLLRDDRRKPCGSSTTSGTFFTLWFLLGDVTGVVRYDVGAEEAMGVLIFEVPVATESVSLQVVVAGVVKSDVLTTALSIKKNEKE